MSERVFKPITEAQPGDYISCRNEECNKIMEMRVIERRDDGTFLLEVDQPASIDHGRRLVIGPARVQ